jgi:hypothetical protein
LGFGLATLGGRRFFARSRRSPPQQRAEFVFTRSCVDLG